MRVLRDISADEMVLEFLRGEIDSPRFGPMFRDVLAQSNLTRALVDNADLTNARDNLTRQRLLGVVRGYGQGQYLFSGVPSGIKWQRVALTKDEFQGLLYANHETWTTLSGGTRLLSDGAANVDRIQTREDANANIRAVAREVSAGRTYPAVIIFGDGHGRRVIAEGHTRATAYVLEAAHLSDEVEVILGLSPAIAAWVYW